MPRHALLPAAELAVAQAAECEPQQRQQSRRVAARQFRPADAPVTLAVASGVVDLRRVSLHSTTGSNFSSEALVAQVTAPVRWEQVVRRLASEGVDTYVEVGPGAVLSGLIRKIDREARVMSVCDPDGVEQAASTLASV